MKKLISIFFALNIFWAPTFVLGQTYESLTGQPTGNTNTRASSSAEANITSGQVQLGSQDTTGSLNGSNNLSVSGSNGQGTNFNNIVGGSVITNFGSGGYRPLTDMRVIDNIGGNNQLVKTMGGNTSAPLAELFNQAVYAMLAVAIGLAIFMIIRGGYEYMTSGDNASGKGAARNRIKASVGGLVLALGSVTLLNFINPEILNVNLNFPALTRPNAATVTPSLSSMGMAGAYITGRPADSSIPGGSEQDFLNGNTVVYAPRIDTDGTNPPPFYDQYHQSQTSLGGLDANTDAYVVVPIGSTIPLGTRVRLYDQNTGLQTDAIVGDRGPTENGLGEISLAAARRIGAWVEGDGDSARNHRIEWTIIR